MAADARSQRHLLFISATESSGGSANSTSKPTNLPFSKMNPEIFLLRPEPGKIIQIYARYGCVDFIHGFCRAVLQAGHHFQFLEGIRRCSDPAMTMHWSEPCDFGIQPRERFYFDIIPEAAWMSERKTGRIK